MTTRLLRTLARVSAVAAVALAGCRGAEQPPSALAPAELRLTALVAGTAVTTIVVTVTAPDIATPLVYNFHVSNEVATGTVVLTAGTDRHFRISAFDAAGIETHGADTTVTIVSGPNAPLTITLQPLTGSQPIVVTIAALRVELQPSALSLVVGTTATFRARVFDATGTDITSQVTLVWASTNPSVANVDSSGVVTALLPGQVAIVAVTAGTAGVAALTISAAPAAIVFATQPPARVEGNVAIAPAVQVTVRDASGQPVPNATVTMAISASPWPGATLSGTTTVTAVNGVATFADLRIDKPGQGYVLQAAAGTASTAAAPFAVGLTFESVDAGDSHTCAVTSGGTYCWGFWYPNQDSVPQLVGGPVFVEVSSGRFHNCGRTAAGAVYCWGFNGRGALGNGTTEDSRVPVLVGGGLTFASVSAGGFHTCALTPSGAAYCWGSDAQGQLGNGAYADSPAPVPVSGGLVFRSVSAGLSHTCGVTRSDEAYCWGSGFAGELGNEAVQIGETRNTPVIVSGGLSFAAVSAGFNITCGVTNAQSGYCWGNGEGGVGDGKFAVESTPALVVGGLSFTAVSAGRSHACSLVTTTPGIQCWGANASGQVGDGTTDPRLTAILIDVGARPTAVTASETHSCALTGSGLLCWGANDAGELGDGTRAQRTVPTRVVQ